MLTYRADIAFLADISKKNCKSYLLSFLGVEVRILYHYYSDQSVFSLFWC